MKLTQDTVVSNQRTKKSQVHGVKSLSIMRHSCNHSRVHTDQEIWCLDFINKTHSTSAISHSSHLSTGLFRHYLPGCLLSSGCMGSHHRGASGNTGKKSPCKLSHVFCLIRPASAPSLHHTLKNRVRIWIHSSQTMRCPWVSSPFLPAPPGAETRVEKTLSAWNRKVRGDLWILPAPWWVTAHRVRATQERDGEMLRVENKHQKVFKYHWWILAKKSIN